MIDLTGKKFGRLTALCATNERRHGQVVWACHCDCGRDVNIVSHSLVAGRSLSCGCVSQEKAHARAHDIRGQKYGRLTPLERLPSGRWRCQCDCGNIADVSLALLKNGTTRSCGCLRKENSREISGDKLARGWEVMDQMRVEGTNMALIKPDIKVNKNSKTGVRGVCMHGDKYRATIMFKRKQYDLGLFDTLEEAAAERLAAEIMHFDKFLEKYGKKGRSNK